MLLMRHPFIHTLHDDSSIEEALYVLVRPSNVSDVIILDCSMQAIDRFCDLFPMQLPTEAET